MLNEIAANYFQNLNPLAEKIYWDISHIKLAYASMWDDFSSSEQDQIINEFIFHPDALFKYSINIADLYEKRTCKFSPGKKLICDELTGATWRDEHSAPFAWRSGSLLGLCESTACVPACPLKDYPPTRKFSATSNIGREARNEEKHIDPAGSGGAFVSFCSKLTSFPRKSLIASFEEKRFLSKITNGAVEKFQNTLKLVGGKFAGACPSSDNDVLVVASSGGAVIVPSVDKCGSPIRKPGVPPPPPPRITLSSKPSDKEGSSEAIAGVIPELQTISEDGSFSAEDESSVLYPKSGFDFLDNW